MSNIKKIAAMLGLGTMLGVMLIPGCLIPIDPNGGTGGSSASSGAGNDAVAAFEGVDPSESSIAELKAEFTAYALQGLIEQNMADPDTVDDATLQQMMDQLAPDAAALADQWVLNLDPAAIPLFSPDPDTMNACFEKFGCEPQSACTFSGGKSSCWLVACGDGKCPTCPNVFNLSNLLVTGWCAHVCLSGAPSRVVGTKIVIHFRKGFVGQHCFEGANDH